MTTLTCTISDPALLAAVAAKAAEQSKDSATFLQDFLTGSCAGWRTDLALDAITASEFILRFTSAEMTAILASTDQNVQGFITQVKALPQVWLGSAAAQQGIAYLVSLNLLTQDRATAILAY